MTIPPLQRQIVVACDIAAAYHRFVHDIGSWWPVESFSVFGEGGRVAYDGTRFVETSPSGDTAVWGTVTASDPPSNISFTWHPGQEPESASQVTVTFAPTDTPDVTLVTLVHTGWETYPNPEATRDSYASGWITVLDRLASVESTRRG